MLFRAPSDKLQGSAARQHELFSWLDARDSGLPTLAMEELEVMPAQRDNLDWLQDWYASQCNGDWEHSWGIQIGNIDNPGWDISVDLRDTKLESKTLERTRVDRTDDDWFHVWTVDRKFVGAGGARNLGDLIRAFRDFVEKL